MRARRGDGEMEVGKRLEGGERTGSGGEGESSWRRSGRVMSGREATGAELQAARGATVAGTVGTVRPASSGAAPRVHRARTRESAMALGQACGRRHAVRARQGWQDREASRTR